MPAYEYSCSECNNTTTIYRGISEDEPQYICNTCNIPIKRVYSSIGVSFNGAGFYSTDK